jgi:lambda family phage portal protein
MVSFKHRVRHNLDKAFRGVKAQAGPTGNQQKWLLGSSTYGYMGNQSGYGNYGASRRKIALEEWRAISGSPDQDIIYNLPLLRVRSRDLFMGSTIAGGAILTLRTNVIGNGLIAMPQIDSDFLGISNEEAAGINKQISDEFDLFADTVECDWDRRSTFYQLQDLAFLNMCISGDVLALLPMKSRPGNIYDTKIRLIEADRVISPLIGLEQVGTTASGLLKIFGGVELTDDGEVAAYWVSKMHPGFASVMAMPSDPGNYTRIPAFGVETNRPVSLLLAEMERPEQRRGVPLMAKCLAELKQMQRYIESTTIQNVIKSYFTSFITSAMPSDQMFDNILDDDIKDDLVQRSPYQVKLGPGMVNWMRPGDTVTFPVNAGPEAQFEPYVIAMCKFIGSCLGIPYEVLLKQFNSSYSASRAAQLEFWRRIKVLRQFMVDQFCQPVYIAMMMEAVSRGVFKVADFFTNPRVFKAWTRCAWAGSSPGSIDPLKEVIASDRKVKLGVSTLERESLELNGSDWRANTVQQGIELKFRVAQGLPYTAAQDTKGNVTSTGPEDLIGSDTSAEAQTVQESVNA